ELPPKTDSLPQQVLPEPTSNKLCQHIQDTATKSSNQSQKVSNTLVDPNNSVELKLLKTPSLPAKIDQLHDSHEASQKSSKDEDKPSRNKFCPEVSIKNVLLCPTNSSVRVTRSVTKAAKKAKYDALRSSILSQLDKIDIPQNPTQATSTTVPVEASPKLDLTKPSIPLSVANYKRKRVSKDDGGDETPQPKLAKLKA
ncbi:hypothetical protein K3495_g17003, partial [Podosphaera aphanis]